MEFSELYKAVIELYQENKSVKQTADILKVSVVKVRRILITEGLWHSKTSNAVGALYKKGLTTDEIAFQLGIGRKNVQAYIPYSRGMYGEAETEDSLRSSLYRERKKDALESVITAQTGPENSKIIDMRSLLTARKPSIREESPQLELGKTIPFSPSGEYTYELKLELVERSYDGKDYEEISSLTDGDLEALLSLAKADSGITRTVLVPSDITLHSLHYLIQKAFGFLNGHLHSFSLLDSDFESITSDNYGRWELYQGSIFRIPDEVSDRFWDEDYDGKTSINSWLKKKYQAPYNDFCASDTYLYQKDRNNAFLKLTSNELGIKPAALKIQSLDSLSSQFYLPDGFNILLERLTVGEIFKTGTRKVDNLLLRSNTERSIAHAKEIISEMKKEDLAVLQKNLELYIGEYASINAVRTGRYHPDELDDEPDVYIDECEFFIEQLRKYLWPAVNNTNPKLEPFTNKLIYRYDFGDDWNILITCINRTVGKIDTPKCIAADGLNLIDNAGGIGGYIEILKEINGEEGPQTAEETKDWARSMGFTGRKRSPENIL